ncbi:A-type flagellin [Anaerobiospirillum thomasii]|nr:A-type flagellin [Anaerobiospirillum thomasii]
MALFVNTNVSSINGQRNLTNATNNLNTTYQRLSSGLLVCVLTQQRTMLPACRSLIV